jgi:hypothetical protein
MKVAINRRFVVEQPKETRIKGQNYVKYILNPEEFPDDKPFDEMNGEAPF